MLKYATITLKDQIDINSNNKTKVIQIMQIFENKLTIGL